MYDVSNTCRLESLANLNLVGSGVTERFAYGKKIAQDLFQYMCSFSSSAVLSADKELMLVPTNILDRWMERFSRKLQLDPNFMLKPDS